MPQEIKLLLQWILQSCIPPAHAQGTHDAAGGDPFMVFLAIGVLINIVVITAYFAWARKQWKKTGSRKDSSKEEP